ncbi:histone lysine demethylase JmjC NO66 [Besnoitia besnoiti]|uniref:Bifunctional lysine-specific demethylase and histidyl-hydroxylase n=1 Tax=Besnoitia besnoiti TaxID=94643 RepID=A0A2A9MJD6_BESBE|nr:histone lysine demethylase JmjC NO66 [Besnoitia besnoiti]PFH36361.1 histone lysine demethylase JmjC NO66 [Besnoitia besnoiti]
MLQEDGDAAALPVAERADGCSRKRDFTPEAEGDEAEQESRNGEAGGDNAAAGKESRERGAERFAGGEHAEVARGDSVPSEGDAVLQAAARTLDEKLFTPDFFQHFWEKQPRLLRSEEIENNPFTGHAFVSEADMACMCYRGAVAETLKVFKEGVALEPPRVPWLEEPSPLPTYSGGSFSPSTSAATSAAPHAFTESGRLLQPVARYLDGCSLDVFLLQLWGCKKWKVYAPPQELPLSDEMLGKREPFPQDPGEPLMELVLREGDVLYIPRGFPHAAETAAEPSLHLTITVPSAEYAYVTCVERLVKRLILRHRLPVETERRCRSALLLKAVPGRSPQAEKELRECMTESAKGLARLVSYETLAASLSEHLREINAMQARQFARLQAFPVKAAFAEDTCVRLSPGLTCECDDGSCEATFFKGTQSLRMKIHTSASRMIRALASKKPHRVSELPCDDAFERLCVLLVLHSKDLVEILP